LRGASVWREALDRELDHGLAAGSQPSGGPIDVPRELDRPLQLAPGEWVIIARRFFQEAGL
jgi:hypothetical protein